MSIIAAALTDVQFVAVVVSAVFGGGGLIAWRKIGPEKQNLVAQAAASVSSAAANLIDEQRQEIDSLRARLEQLEGHIDSYTRRDSEREEALRRQRAAEAAAWTLVEHLAHLAALLRENGIEVPRDVLGTLGHYQPTVERPPPEHDDLPAT